MSDAATVSFDPDALPADLPEEARRYLTHAIRPGAAIPRTAEVVFAGELRMGPGRRWMPFRARETLIAASGLVFSARARLGPLPVTTEDRYQAGHAQSRIRLLGLLPIVSKRGPDADRAMRSRLVVESVWLPSTFLPQAGASWTEKNDQLHVIVPVHGEDVHATVRLGSAGEPREMRMDRWSDLTDNRSYTLIPFETRMETERSFGDYTIPARLRAAWWAGTEREFEFFRATVEQAAFAS
jgi:hypothetical protein